MNYDNACEILEISGKHTNECLKKAYFRMALKYHPDKYTNDNGEKFKEIKEAYDFLCCSSWNPVHDRIKIDENINYKELIKMCIKYFSPETNWNDLFIDTSFKGIIKDCQKVSVKIFDKLNKKKAKQVFDFINEYNTILNIDQELLQKFKGLLQKKMVYENIIILNPTLKDLFNDNIFKLIIEEKEFYVPLWHHELYYSLQNKDLIVKCEPELEKNMWIDYKNNLYVLLEIPIKDLFEKENYEFKIGEKLFKIEGKDLKIIKEKQVIILKNEGILRINEEHTYDASIRGDIYLEVLLI